MTQQYIVGEFSVLLAGLESTGQERLGDGVGNLRREVERSPLTRLPQLAREALDLTDMLCWFTLDRGDVHGFCRCAKTATALREFAASANLLI